MSIVYEGLGAVSATRYSTKAPRWERVPVGQYTSLQVARVAGVSLRQFRCWAEWEGAPDTEAHRRLYTLEQATAIAVIGDLRRKGMSLQKIRGLLKAIHRAVAGLVVDGPPVYLVTDGDTAKIEKHDRLLAVVARAQRPVFVVCVTDQVEKLRKAAAETREDPRAAWR